MNKLMKPFDMSYDGFFKNNIENLYKYNYTEDDCKALCMTPLAKSEFRNCVISDDNFNPGDDEKIRKTFKSKTCGLLATDNDSYYGFFYCKDDDSFYEFSDEIESFYRKVSFNFIKNIAGHNLGKTKNPYIAELKDKVTKTIKQMKEFVSKSKELEKKYNVDKPSGIWYRIKNSGKNSAYDNKDYRIGTFIYNDNYKKYYNELSKIANKYNHIRLYELRHGKISIKLKLEQSDEISIYIAAKNCNYRVHDGIINMMKNNTSFEDEFKYQLSNMESEDTVMKRQDFEALLEAVYNAGYEQAELDIMNEDSKHKRNVNINSVKPGSFQDKLHKTFWGREVFGDRKLKKARSRMENIINKKNNKDSEGNTVIKIGSKEYKAALKEDELVKKAKRMTNKKMNYHLNENEKQGHRNGILQNIKARIKHNYDLNKIDNGWGKEMDANYEYRNKKK